MTPPPPPTKDKKVPGAWQRSCQKVQKYTTTQWKSTVRKCTLLKEPIYEVFPNPWLISGFGLTNSFVKSRTIYLYSSAWFLKTVTQHIGYHFHVFLLLFKPLQLLLKIFFFSLPAHFFSLFVPDNLFYLGGEECVNWSLHKQTKNHYNLLIVKSVIAY